MEETTTTSTTSNSRGNNSMMLIIGALVLAAILGYVVFSSAKSDDSNTQPVNTESNGDDTQPMEESTDGAQIDETTMNGDTDDMTTIPSIDMKLDVNNSGDGETMDTRDTNPNVKTFNLEGGSFYYKPNTITVSKGDSVRVTLKSVDMMHDFVIDELGVKMPVTKAGETGTVEFTADKAGTYEFYCSVGQHRQQGMVGTLIVQ